ncbi:hypothetical protein M422DRAFT_46200 [Sphaerobolus stellatus SS14]|nr:hypothetical protein M422DRAFT_46200 [Sphaerobolus stellatus SS14]
MASTQVHIKLIQKYTPDRSVHIRMVSLPDWPSWTYLSAYIENLFDIPKDHAAVSYVDRHLEEITMSSDDELKRFFSGVPSTNGPPLVKLFVKPLTVMRKHPEKTNKEIKVSSPKDTVHRSSRRRPSPVSGMPTQTSRSRIRNQDSLSTMQFSPPPPPSLFRSERGSVTPSGESISPNGSSSAKSSTRGTNSGMRNRNANVPSLRGLAEELLSDDDDEAYATASENPLVDYPDKVEMTIIARFRNDRSGRLYTSGRPVPLSAVRPLKASTRGKAPESRNHDGQLEGVQVTMEPPPPKRFNKAIQTPHGLPLRVIPLLPSDPSQWNRVNDIPTTRLPAMRVTRDPRTRWNGDVMESPMRTEGNSRFMEPSPSPLAEESGAFRTFKRFSRKALGKMRPRH